MWQTLKNSPVAELQRVLTACAYSVCLQRVPGTDPLELQALTPGNSLELRPCGILTGWTLQRIPSSVVQALAP